MPNPKTQRLTVSGPTFAELSVSLNRTIGLQSTLSMDGGIMLGEIEIVSDGEVPVIARAARVAAQLSELTPPRDDEAPSWHEGNHRVYVRCMTDGVHIIQHGGPGGGSEIVIPLQAVLCVATDALDCLTVAKG